MTASGELRTHHFGPHPGYVGGMGTVLALFGQRRIGADSVTVHPTWVPHSHPRAARLTLSALRTVERLDADEIVHVHLSTRGSFARKGAILSYASRRKLPTVVSLHGADFAEFADRHPWPVARVLRLASVITALSGDAEAAARRLAPGAVVRQVPNPILIPDRVTPASRTDSVVLFAGEVGIRKGADVLERAWAIVHGRLPRARCIMIGPDGDFSPRPTESLTVLPAAGPDAVGALLREARVAVLPSRAEGMPMFLLEAMAAGRPFVSTPVGAIAGLAESGGMLVPVGDHEALAAALIELLDDPGRAERLGRRGQELCRATRSPELVGGLYQEVYRDAQDLARARRPERTSLWAAGSTPA
jgi:glycosyltransferase involved in cell wall biosynthesis